MPYETPKSNLSPTALNYLPNYQPWRDSSCKDSSTNDVHQTKPVQFATLLTIPNHLGIGTEIKNFRKQNVGHIVKSDNL